MAILDIVNPYLGSTLPSTLTTLLVGLTIWVLYGVWLVIFRLYLSPISHFPGPKLAAVTFWYEFYYDVIQPGQYSFHIMELHKIYGPVVRINPRELHFYPPSFYEEIYAGPSRRRDRWDFYTKAFGMPGAGASTNPHDLHKLRRSALSPYFSKQSVRKLSSVVVEERADVLMRRIKGFGEKAGDENRLLNLEVAFAAFAYDVAVEYSFARSDRHLEAEDFNPWMLNAAVGTSSLGQVGKHIYPIFWCLINMPDWLAKRLDPNASRYFQFKRDINTQINAIRHGADTAHKTASHTTIFHEILNSNLPTPEKATPRLADEGATVVSAGTVTTAWTLAVAVFYLLRTPSVLRKLKTELHAAVDDPTAPFDLVALEQLPYLTAVIQESLRRGYGICTRLERIAPDENLLFRDDASGRDWVVPRGTPVSMTSLLVHRDPDVFPEPFAFRPERWLENPRLDRYLVAFSKGKMQCLGINLAYAELYLMLAKIFRVYGSSEVKFDGDIGKLELFETGVEDIECAHDRFIPLPKSGTKGVRVKVELF